MRKEKREARKRKEFPFDHYHSRAWIWFALFTLTHNETPKQEEEMQSLIESVKQQLMQTLFNGDRGKETKMMVKISPNVLVSSWHHHPPTECMKFSFSFYAYAGSISLTFLLATNIVGR